jgi:hypothetical protein
VVVGRVVRIEPCRVAPLARQTDDSGETGARERVDGVVDRGKAHRRKALAKALEEILRGRMRRIAREQAHDGDSLRRELQP